VPEVALGRLRLDGGRWFWDLDTTHKIDQADADAASGTAPTGRRRRAR
jgi:hypothetical protein